MATVKRPVGQSVDGRSFTIQPTRSPQSPVSDGGGGGGGDDGGRLR